MIPPFIALSARNLVKKYTNGNEEIYYGLAEDWFTFLEKAFPSAVPFLLPNNRHLANNILRNSKINLVILTGGDDWGVFKQRDAVEFDILSWALEQHIPVLGVCRGMQVINKFYGGTTVHCSTCHIATHHNLIAVDNDVLPLPTKVNSYHNNCISPETLAPPLKPLAYTADGTIEALIHPYKNVAGIMWHPERNGESYTKDIQLIKQLLLSKKDI